MTNSRWIGPVVAVTLAGLASCEAMAPQTGRAVGVRHSIERIEPSADPARINPSRFAEVVPRIAYVRAEPARIELKVEERISFRDIRLFAFDADGRTLGYLAIYDRGMEPGAAVMDAEGGISARYEGESTLVLRVPLWSASGGTGAVPEARVPVIVRR